MVVPFIEGGWIVAIFFSRLFGERQTGLKTMTRVVRELGMSIAPGDVACDPVDPVSA
jgi:hypothetical protein